jgi:hypothetical protein
MNRLWVRFTLMITGMLMLVALVPVLYSLSIEHEILAGPNAMGQLDDIRAALPEEMQVEFDERMQNFAQNYFSRSLVGASLLSALIAILLSRSLTAPLQALETGGQRHRHARFIPPGSREGQPGNTIGGAGV